MSQSPTQSEATAPAETFDWAALAAPTLVTPGSAVHLHKDFDAGRTDAELGKTNGLAALAAAKAELESWQEKFYAQAQRSMLICIQAIDAAGKDSTIRSVMSGVNPEGVDVYGFRQPTSVEIGHDYLWRHNLALPELGKIAIFNRSHYENVLETRVNPDTLWPRTSVPAPQHLWKQRYRQINDWERYLTEEGTIIIKLFLHVSKEEQAKRFLERCEDPSKNWKVSATDMSARSQWDDYTQAFTEMLNATSTDWAPWHVIPADHKWFSHLSSFAVVLEAMRKLNPSYPSVTPALKDIIAKEKAELLTGK